MGIDIQLFGGLKGRGLLSRWRGPTPLDEIARWWEREVSEGCRALMLASDEAGRPTLFLQAYYPAEDARIRASDKGRIEVEARTNGAGPGYHIWLCDQLKRPFSLSTRSLGRRSSATSNREAPPGSRRCHAGLRGAFGGVIWIPREAILDQGTEARKPPWPCIARLP